MNIWPSLIYSFSQSLCAFESLFCVDSLLKFCKQSKSWNRKAKMLFWFVSIPNQFAPN